MKKVIFLIFLSLSFHTLVFAETEKELFDKGVLLFKQGQAQEAIHAFSKLIEIAPGNADAYKNRGVSYMKQKKFDLAIQDFKKAKELFPELKGLYSNLGVAWYYKEAYEEAIKNYDIEIEMEPENHVAYFNRALCFGKMGRNKKAFDDLSKTLELKPDFHWATRYKADLLAQQEEKNTKAETSKKAIQKDPVSMYALQSGAYLNPANANKMKTKLFNNGFDPRILILKDSRDRTWYLVRSGSYANQDDAQKASVSLKNKIGINPVIRPAGTW